jgi:(+)-trans-carveol dehydrogenase
MGKLDGKVALVTGAARGQGRSHALLLAQEGADIIAVDMCRQIGTVPYPMATSDDLSETERLVEKTGRRIVVREADVRDGSALQVAVAEGVSELGRLDIVSANAGILSIGVSWEIEQQAWQDMLDVNLTGVWNTCKAAIPSILNGGRGGSLILTSSQVGLKGMANIAHYVAAKHGVIGLMRTLAIELADYHVRVNAVCPANVSTGMFVNDAITRLFVPGEENPTDEQFAAAASGINLLPVPWIEPQDVSNAVLWLASDDARYVTGVALPVDAGMLTK